MELWIRSQDELLLTKIDYIIVNGLDIFNQNQLIGTYQTYERALEVLDEIQKLLKPKIMMKYNDDCTMSVSEIELQPSTYVYEMPKE